MALVAATSGGAASPDLRVFYALDGDVAPADMRAADAPGYQASAPVHVGNAAAGQTQLGCFGNLLDAVWHYVGNSGCLDPADGAMIAALAGGGPSAPLSFMTSFGARLAGQGLRIGLTTVVCSCGRAIEIVYDPVEQWIDALGFSDVARVAPVSAGCAVGMSTT